MVLCPLMCSTLFAYSQKEPDPEFCKAVATAMQYGLDGFSEIQGEKPVEKTPTAEAAFASTWAFPGSESSEIQVLYGTNWFRATFNPGTVELMVKMDYLKIAQDVKYCQAHFCCSYESTTTPLQGITQNSESKTFRPVSGSLKPECDKGYEEIEVKAQYIFSTDTYTGQSELWVKGVKN